MHCFTATLWRWEGDAPWYFLTVPGDVSDEVRATSPPRRGFGSVRVRITLGSSSWATSVFPDSTRGAYLLPVKRCVREAEGLEVGELVDVELEVR